MNAHKLIQEFKVIQGVSDAYEIFLKASGEGGWNELKLRRAKKDELIAANIRTEVFTAVIVAEGDETLTVKSFIKMLRGLPEQADVYAMIYDKTGEGKLGGVSVVGLVPPRENAGSKMMVAISASELNPT